MGTTLLHVHRVWYVGPVPNYGYIACHVDHYVKVHQVQIKFWLIMANSASGHSFRHPPSVLVMIYSLTA